MRQICFIFIPLLALLQGCGTVGAAASVASATVTAAGVAVSATAAAASAGAAATKAVAETGGKLIDMAAQQAARDEAAKKAAETLAASAVK